MSTTQLAYVSQKTRQWAMSAVILGSLFVLLSLPNVFQFSKSAAMFGTGKAAVSLVLTIVSLLVSVAFIVGGVSTLKGSAGGRETLSYAGAGGAAMTVLSCVWGLIMFNDPVYAGIFNQAKGAGGGPALPPDMVSHILLGMEIAVVVMTIIQLAYCIGIYRNMSAETADVAAPLDAGAWPPPPLG